MTLRAIVIGAGVGALVAAELAQAGLNVTLVDDQPRPLSGASGRHGRRLHLGEHYSGDAVGRPAGLNTGQTCFIGALALVSRWPDAAETPGRWWQFITDDSMTSPDEYLAYLESLREFQAAVESNGFGLEQPFGPPSERHRTLGMHEYASRVDVSRIALAVESREPVIDANALHRHLMRSLAASTATVLPQHHVTAIDGTLGDFTVTATTPKGTTRLHADVVVNAAWHGIAELSERLGVEPVESTARLRVIADVRLPSGLADAPSMYFHRGPFGNHTNVGRSRGLLLAEEVCNLAQAQVRQLPPSWQAFVSARAGDHAWTNLLASFVRSPETINASLLEELVAAAERAGSDPARRAAAIRDQLAALILRAYARWVPGASAMEVNRLIPNVVISLGDVDLHRPDSDVHRRDAFVRSPRPGYLEVFTGKLTYLVLIAEEVLARVTAVRDQLDDDVARDMVQTPLVRQAWPCKEAA